VKVKSLLLGVGAICFVALSFRSAFAEDAPPKTAPLAERVTIATQLYNAISTYYAQWKGSPDFDLDKEYDVYLNKILNNDDRRDFALASQAFIAKLNSGHSNFYDDYMYEVYGKYFGFYAMPLRGEWTVITSRIDAVKPGDVLSTIDGQDFGEFYLSKRPFLSGSDEPSRAAHFFYRRYLFPQTFVLGLSDGRKVEVKRIAPPPAAADPDDATEVREADGVLYVRIPGFEDSKLEDAAVEAVKSHLNAKAIIVDVRGNGGGSTPEKLLSVLMDRPYQEWSEATPVRMGVLEIYQNVGPHPFLHWSAPVLTPAQTHYTGQVLILTDVRCFSACEDFVEPFKANHRATIVGGRTGGSTGQPYFKTLGDGFSFSISAKREYFPDGSEFEGIGMTPDVAIELTPADLKAGRDPVLANAKSLIK
jgi:carboxyl-terminal processing protease